jgi:hypothetical protein
VGAIACRIVTAGIAVSPFEAGAALNPAHLVIPFRQRGDSALEVQPWNHAALALPPLHCLSLVRWFLEGTPEGGFIGDASMPSGRSLHRSRIALPGAGVECTAQGESLSWSNGSRYTAAGFGVSAPALRFLPGFSQFLIVVVVYSVIVVTLTAPSLRQRCAERTDDHLPNVGGDLAGQHRPVRHRELRISMTCLYSRARRSTSPRENKRTPEAVRIAGNLPVFSHRRIVSAATPIARAASEVVRSSAASCFMQDTVAKPLDSLYR